MLDEKDFFTERDELITATLQCPKCRATDDYPIRWRRRTRKGSLPPRADEVDRAKFAKLRDYRIRVDDKLRCKNPRCGRTIEITTIQSIVFD